MIYTEYLQINPKLPLYILATYRSFLSKSDMNIEQSSPYLKTRIILAHSEVLKWALADLRRITLESRSIPPTTRGVSRGARSKENMNNRDRMGLGTLSSARFILGLLGILSENLQGSEVSFLISSGILSVIQTLLTCAGTISCHSVLIISYI